jgi:hypothetical protein
MNRILLMVLAALLILSIFASGCTGYILYLAPIYDIDIWADNSSPPHYFVDVVNGEHTSCDSFNSYNVTRAGNTTIRVEIINKHVTGEPCEEYVKYVDHTIPLGSYFVPGGNYTVEINDVTVNFVAGVIMIYPALIIDIKIWADGSLPPEYFVDVKTEESSICDQFDSYNVTRAGNTTIIVDIFNRRCCTGCPDPDEMYDPLPIWHTIPLGSDFVTGGNYTVMVNNVTETFVAE